MVDFDGKFLRLGADGVPSERVHGFVERYSPWSGRAWIEVEGTGRTVAIDETYGDVRSRLRRWFPDRPFQSEWGDGRFPPAPMGGPADLVLCGAVVLGAAVCGSVGWHGGLGAGALTALALAWPLVRLRDRVEVAPSGIRVGPWWAPQVPWYAAGAVRFHVSGRLAWVWLEGTSGGGPAAVPAILLPALRARVRRLGGHELVRGAPEVEARYARWRAPAVGVPWGVLVGAAVAAPFATAPWTAWLGGLLVSVVAAFAGAAVEARAGGWGLGAVVWLTGAYATVLAALSLALWSA